jgi:hypothetical protein
MESEYPVIKEKNNSFADGGWVFSVTANRNFFMSGFKKNNGFILNSGLNRFIVLDSGFLFRWFKMRKVCN